MTYKANATKPERNKSLIVDLNKRNLKSELTVTIPDNDVVEIEMIDVGNGYWYGCHAFGVLSTLANSKLFQYFVNCFDQLKVMDCHYCIDESVAPVVKVTYNNMIQHYVANSAQYSFDNGVTWNNYDITNVNDMYINGHAGEDNWKFLSAANARILGNAFNSNAAVHLVVNEENEIAPFNVIVAASRRSVPEGFYQVGNNPFRLPSYDELMSYGSAIYQSKMPGANIHLSLDVAGTSNSERMMTFPTQMMNRLSLLTPSLQNGRFCPIIYIGCRVRIPTNGEVLQKIVDDIAYNPKDVFVDWNNGDVHLARYTSGWYYINVPGLANGANIQTLFRFKDMYDYAGVEDPIGNGDVTVESTKKMNVSVQGYHSIRFKQLRTIATDKSYKFSFIKAVLTGKDVNKTFATAMAPGVVAPGLREYGVAAFNRSIDETYDFSDLTFGDNTGSYYVWGLVCVRRSGDAIETMVISLQRYDGQATTNVLFSSTGINSFYTNFKDLIDQYEKCYVLFRYLAANNAYFSYNEKKWPSGEGKQLAIQWAIDRAGNGSNQWLSTDAVFRTVVVNNGEHDYDADLWRITNAAFYNTEINLN